MEWLALVIILYLLWSLWDDYKAKKVTGLSDAWLSALQTLKLPKDHYKKAFMKKHTRKSTW
jgi:hypothetical protein